jgi:hypothetical protein
MFGLSQVCPDWRDTLYGQPEFWREVRPVLHCRDIRSWSSSANSPVSVTTSTTSGLSNHSRVKNVNVVGTNVKVTKVKVANVAVTDFKATSNQSQIFSMSKLSYPI